MLTRPNAFTELNVSTPVLTANCRNISSGNQYGFIGKLKEQNIKIPWYGKDAEFINLETCLHPPPMIQGFQNQR